MLSKNADAGLAEKAALGGMLILGTVILTAVLGFFVGIPIGIYTLLVPLAVLLLVAFFRDRTLFWAVLAEIGFAVLWAVLCAFIYDSSFDGMYYHKQAVITLKEGWNPVYGSCLTENQFSNYLDIALWLDNYPKGLWSFSAAVYALTNLIETAKVVNLFFVICVFALGYDVMRTVFRSSRKKSFAFALLFSINPVFIQQIFTFYNDLAVGAVVVMAALLGVKIYEDCATGRTYLLLFITVAVSCTIKFTAPVLVGLVLLVFGVSYALKCRKRLSSIRRPVVVVLAAFLAGVLVLGFNPYIVHLIQGKHVIHPVMGAEKYDIMNTNPPEAFAGKSGAEQLFMSLFSKTENDMNQPLSLKIPFTVTSDELEDAGSADVRIGGFGVLFGGVLCVSVLLALIAAIYKTRMKGSLAIMLAAFVGLALFFPESWWARYASYVYYIPVLLLLYATNLKKIKWLNALLYAAVVANSCIVLWCMLSMRIEITQGITSKLDDIKADGRSIVVRFNDFPSQIAWFEEHGIQFEVSHSDIGDAIPFYGTTKYKFVDGNSGE